MLLDRTIRKIDTDLLDEINHACIDLKKDQGEIINEAMTLWLTQYNRKKEKKKNVHKS